MMKTIFGNSKSKKTTRKNENRYKKPGILGSREALRVSVEVKMDELDQNAHLGKSYG